MRTFKYALLAVVTAALSLAMAGCDDNDDEAGLTPGRNEALYTPSEIIPKVMGTTVALKWRGSQQAVAYRVELSENQGFTAPVSVTTQSAGYTFEELSTRTDYYVRVKALADDERYNSAWSQAKPLTTGDENILHATPVAVTPATLTVSWTAAATVTHLTYVPASGDGVTPVQTLSLASGEIQAGQKFIGALDYETDYIVRLYNGDNLRGEGEFKTSAREMSPLTVLPNPGTFSAAPTWTANSEVTYFTLAKSSTPNTKSTVTLTDGEKTLGACALTGLEPGTDYILDAFWTNPDTGTATGLGTTAFTTQALAGMTLTASAVLETTATLSWTPAADAYITQLVFSPARAAGAVTVTSADNGTKNITGLVAGTTYDVKLQYVETVGGKTYDRAGVTFTTQQSIPTATVSSSAVGNNTVTIAWTPANAADAKLVFTPALAGGDVTVTSADAGGKVVSGLVAGTAYTVKLVAGAGNFERGSTTFTTTGTAPAVNKFWNFSDAPATTYTDASGSVTVLTDMTILANSKVKTDASSKSIDGYNFAQRLNLGGAGVGAPAVTAVAAKFDVTGPCTITTYVVAGAAARSMALSDGTTQLTTFNYADTNITKNTYSYTGGAGSLYFYSTSGGMYVFAIGVTY